MDSDRAVRSERRARHEEAISSGDVGGGRLRDTYVEDYNGGVISPATAKVLAAFLDDPKAEQYGFGLMRSTRLKSGSLYPILDRLVQRGWLEVHDEDIDEAAEGRPRRRLYRITPRGERDAPVAFHEFREGMAAVLGWAPSPAV